MINDSSISVSVSVRKDNGTIVDRRAQQTQG